MNKSIFLTTCGRCGTHWVKYILSQVLGLQIELPNHGSCGVGHERDNLYPKAVFESESSNKGGFIYTGHIPLQCLHDVSRYVNVIFLVRDLRDVCVSSTHYDVHRKHNHDDFEKLLKKRLNNICQAPRIFRNFLEESKRLEYRLLRFEDMVQNTFEETKKLLRGLGYEVSDDKIRRVLTHSTFQNMSGGRNPGDEIVGHHYRKGVIGDWKNYLSDEDNEEYMRRHGEIMNALGYK